jgi:hypothetical protein
MKSWRANDSPLREEEGEGEVPIPAPLTDTALKPTRDAEPLAIAHLERDLRLVQRYAFIHSDAPFTSNVPLIGPLIVALKRAGRRMLRGALSASMGTQDEFNASVANILFEFTRRAASPAPLTLNEAAVDQVLNRLSAASGDREQVAALTMLAREMQLLREQVRAAQLSASASERLASELLRRVAALEAKRDTDENR